MTMKKLFTTIICAATVCGVTAAESVLRNGDFEIVEKRAKATSKHLMGQIKQGWNIGNNGPVLELPKWWLVNNGKGTLRIITAGEKGENKENVKNGKNSLYFESRGGQFMCTAPKFKPGKYTLKFSAKGKGALSFNCYCYGINPKTGKVARFITSEKIHVLKDDTANAWKDYTQVVEIGKKTEGAKECTFAFYGTYGAFYLDDISLTPVK